IVHHPAQGCRQADQAPALIAGRLDINATVEVAFSRPDRQGPDGRTLVHDLLAALHGNPSAFSRSAQIITGTLHE
ncbi:MAG: hypothetical protein Q7I95_05100, partial [Thiobacillus sp.]|nr:hypothetical protein [Thiobacillus sp.]